VYGQDPLTPLELELKTERTFEEPELEGFLEARLDCVADLEAERELALEKTLDVQQERKKRFDRRLRFDPVYEGDSVLYKGLHKNFPGKLHISWMGPFKVMSVFDNGFLQLATLEGETLSTRTNGSRVRKFYDLKDFL
jgi:hypothetical protein